MGIQTKMHVLDQDNEQPKSCEGQSLKAVRHREDSHYTTAPPIRWPDGTCQQDPHCSVAWKDQRGPKGLRAYRGAVHESTGASPNLLILGRELEGPLDVTTKAPSDAPPLQTDYGKAFQKRLASTHDLARQHLNGAAIHQKRNHSLLVILFVCTGSGERKGEIPNFTALGRDLIWSYQCCQI